MNMKQVRNGARSVGGLPVRGMTLIELMVAVALLAIMLGLAAPSFNDFRRNADLTSTANTFLTSVSVARAEAMKRSLNVYVAPTGTTWAGGWRVFADIDNNQAYTDGTDAVISESPAFPTGVSVNETVNATGFVDNAARYVMFNGSGYPRLNNAAFLSGTMEIVNQINQTRCVALSPVGRVRVYTATSCTESP
jgi:type IV fimbrial biogenesis protein FimT